MKRRITCVMALVLLLNAASFSALGSVLLEDGFEGSPGTAVDPTNYEWGGEVAKNGTGQLTFQTWSVNHSWLLSKTGAAPTAEQILVLQLRAYAYAEDWIPGVYGDSQPRGLRVGSDANNAVEFYSISRTSVGLRSRKDGIESMAAYAIPSGVDSMHDYEISVTPTSACFKVDGVLAGTFTTNIPAGVLSAYASTEDGGAGNVPISLDSLSLTLVQLGAPDFNYYTNSEDGTITIERYIGSGGAVIIPNAINGLPVTSIGMNAFYSCASLTSVTIPDGITSIGTMAFVNCTSLTHATIGNSVTNIGYHAFFSCSSLMAFTAGALNPSFSSVDGVLFDKDQSTVILCPAQKAGSYSIPGTVRNIAEGAFDHCASLIDVTIPDSVTNVGSGAFYSCTSLAGITIGNHVVNIGNLAFFSCTSLTNVTIPDSVVCISGAFSDCTSLTGVTLGNSVADIGGAFVRCARLASVTIPQSVARIGDMAFAGCTSLTNVMIPESVTSIGDSAFSACGNLTAITIPGSVVSIGNYTFHYCTGLTGITIPNSVTSIGQYAFRDCSNLSAVYFTGNALNIDTSVFSGDNNVIVYYLPGATGWGTTFGDRPTVLWNPQARTGDASFGVRTNRFGFTITGASNLVIVVEACTDLANPTWRPVGTNMLTDGASEFSDPQWTNHPACFYRLRSP